MTPRKADLALLLELERAKVQDLEREIAERHVYGTHRLAQVVEMSQRICDLEFELAGVRAQIEALTTCARRVVLRHLDLRDLRILLDQQAGRGGP